MKSKSILCLLMTLMLSACGKSGEEGTPGKTADSVTPAGNAAPATKAIEYPKTATVEHTDDYNGVSVADPYRWLENDVRDSPEVAAWVEEQNKISFGFLESLPDRQRVKQRLTKLWDYERYGLPVQRGGRYFYRRNNGLQNQSVLYVQDGLEAEARMLADPNAWSADGATAMGDYYPSPDGSLVAYTVQDGGSDWRTVKVLKAEDGAVLEDSVQWVKFSNVSWKADGSGFYYSRYPEPKPEAGSVFQELNYNHSVWFHRIGAAQADDAAVYSRPEQPEHGFIAEATDDGRWLLITVWLGTDDRYELVLMEPDKPEAAPRTLVSGFENDYVLAGNEGDVFYFRTDRGAARGRVVAMDVKKPEEKNWREVIPESDATLTGATLIGGRLIAEYLNDARTVVKVYNLDGKTAGEVALPGIGFAEGFEGKAESPETFYVYSSFNQPPVINRLNSVTLESSVFKSPQVAFDPSAYVVEQVFYESKDGTRIPMFITHRRDVPLDGNNPTLLYGYGGFNISVVPEFLVSRFGWLDMGGVYAVANLRGGGEYGQSWHDAGRLHRKQNVFDDFIAAAEYLIKSGWTSPAHLGVYGRSNGGLLIGAVQNQRPDLFAATLPAVGVMDMLRFNQFTAGRFWVDDYGDPGKPDDFKAIYAYSPYHNIKTGTQYPPTLATTADTDDRVVPGHSFKYMARLQAAQAGDAPVLIRIETRAGHGSGKPTDKQIEETADMWTFLAHFTGLKLAAGYGAP